MSQVWFQIFPELTDLAEDRKTLQVANSVISKNMIVEDEKESVNKGPADGVIFRQIF